MSFSQAVELGSFHEPALTPQVRLAISPEPPGVIAAGKLSNL